MTAAVEILGVLFGQMTDPAWIAQRYEAKASRLRARWWRMPESQRITRRGVVLMRRVALYESRANAYRRLL